MPELLPKDFTLFQDLSNLMSIDNATLLRALDEISVETADELQKETGRSYPKDSGFTNPSTGNTIVFISIEDLEQMAGKLDPDVSVTETRNLFRHMKRTSLQEQVQV